jgi:RimJ/RimL family protein N-acetyltransferase
MLIPLRQEPRAAEILYELMEVRKPEQNIRHKEMPSWMGHLDFINSHPYLAWFLIKEEGVVVGQINLSRDRKVGIWFFPQYQRKGYGGKALRELQAAYPGPMLAEINPHNAASRAFFEQHGGKLIQVTYELA